jgi:pyrimidine-nucleoside phosphorylase
MTAYEIIAKKRDGNELSKEEIHYFITEFLQGKIKDYQMSALLMAIFLKGMNEEEVFALTDTYLHSGDIIDLSGISGIKVDKHSTGGVGDKVSIILAPMVASLGVPVPMISGRGLGHTGGTLDKLESISGFKIFGSMESFRQQVLDIGLAMFGQTNSIVPADKRIYALRDVTATIESVPLIIASIMSKKIAEGIDGLVLDVKCGNGAFVSNCQNAEGLAKKLIQVGQAFNKKVTAYLTSMDQPLGYKIGNWLEIEECIDCMNGKCPKDLLEVSLTLASEMLVIGGKAKDLDEGRDFCQQALNENRVFKKFVELVEYQGGNPDVLLSPLKYPKAKFHQEIVSTRRGFVSGFLTKELGLTAVALGAGRYKAEDPVDPQAGIILHKKIGECVECGDVLFEIYTNKESVVSTAEQKLLNTIIITEEKSPVPELIIKRVE